MTIITRKSSDNYECSQEEYAHRLAICISCSEFIPETEGCKGCKTCNQHKRLDKRYTCPLLKWKPTH